LKCLFYNTELILPWFVNNHKCSKNTYFLLCKCHHGTVDISMCITCWWLFNTFIVHFAYICFPHLFSNDICVKTAHMGRCLASADNSVVVDNQIFYRLVIRESPQASNHLHSPYTSTLLALVLSTIDFVSVHNQHAVLQISGLYTNATHKGCSLKWSCTCWCCHIESWYNYHMKLKAEVLPFTKLRLGHSVDVSSRATY